MISFETIGKWIRTLPADKELVEAGMALYATPECVRFENAIEAVAAAYGAGTTRDPATGRIATISPPATPVETPATQAGGRPSGSNRGGLMPADAR